MKNLAIFFFAFLALCFSSGREFKVDKDLVVAIGQLPNTTIDRSGGVQLVYGNGDSILYSCLNEKASDFLKPALIAVIPHVYTFATRGPQIAETTKGLIVTACTSSGNIYSFYKEENDRWTKGGRVNDVDTVAKEGLTGLAADGNSVFAVWLDLRGNRRNKIVGARSTDGGRTWSKNVLIYASPDGTVCECCKPSVVVKGNNVYVMFRNWLNGNRDLYLAQSKDGGKTFSKPQKLGTGSWKLNGCPMDGGGLAVSRQGVVQTVWQREGKIFAAASGKPEREIGTGRGCTVTVTNGKPVYAWTEKGEVVVLNSEGQKLVLGKGIQPIIKTKNNGEIVCVWENEKQIRAALISQ
ncbi:sialidase family protein [Flavisolibacter ginsenosidimutans]|uniref:Exo-alpha-sialidase n=1 Tax=Flavisolibacter ginsenosidimutans TaxID=661481 RepID=A0A5B8UGR9_9BACT|nr:sialidase family protein [Flavisolibacter ginsenosidimutans]QEC55708.1 exo-alpha-sialidase [Flavisolibacter ginsenosidimutans]